MQSTDYWYWHCNGGGELCVPLFRGKSHILGVAFPTANPGLSHTLLLSMLPWDSEGAHLNKQ